MVSRTFQDLQVWQKAHAWVIDIYRITGRFPREELYGLTAQLRKAAVSVPANVAEGFKRRGKADKVRFFNISQASLEECRYYLILARDLGYAQTNGQMATTDEIARMLDSYMRAVAGEPPDLRRLSCIFLLLSPVFCLLSSLLLHS